LPRKCFEAERVDGVAEVARILVDAGWRPPLLSYSGCPPLVVVPMTSMATNTSDATATAGLTPERIALA
jgi:hypothetical protein